jgi:hypothetical protein
MAKNREFVNIVLRIYFDSIAIQVCILGVALLSCIIYIEQTYTDVENVEIEIFFFTTFLFDYVMCVAEANRKRDYIFSPMGIADLLSMIPLVGIFIGKKESREQRSNVADADAEWWRLSSSTSTSA